MTAVQQDIDEAGRFSPALHRALTYLFENMGGDAPALPIIGAAYIFDDDTIADHSSSNTGLPVPDEERVTGEGVALEPFTIGTETGYRGFSVEAGTYYAQLSAPSGSTTTDVLMRSHTAFPTTAALVATLGTSVEAHTAAAAQFVAALLTVTVTTKIWGYIDSADAQGATMFIHKLA